MARGKKYINNHIMSGYDSMPLPELIALLQGELAAMPAELRDYKHAANMDDGSLWVTYERPETDEEMAEREQAESRHRAQQEAAERATYERLKAKFGE